MPDSAWTPSISAAKKQQAQAQSLRDLVTQGAGVRVGESTVASLRLHLLTPSQPECVAILVDHDAGQVFYRRPRRNEVLHLDVFHEEGDVTHRQLARALYASLRAYLRHQGLSGTRLLERCRKLCSLLDIQTATGGGRVTGTLAYGRKKSLRRAHRSHVHLAMQLPDGDWPRIFTIIDAVERTILAAGLELRSPRRLAARSGGSAPMDMTPYTDESDSHLLPAHRRGGGHGRDSSAAAGQPSPFTMPCGGEADALMALARQLKEAGDEERLQQAIQQLTRAQPLSAGEIDEPTRRLARKLVEDDWLQREGERYRLTQRGRQLLKVLQRRSRTAASLAALPGDPLVQGPRSAAPGRRRRTSGGWVLSGPDSRDWERIAVRPTLWTALRRRLSDDDAPAKDGTALRITPGDLRGLRRPQPGSADICLLIDASASMAGERMEAARYLARYLTGASGDRVAVITFQERRVDLRVDFTRSPRQLALGLADIEAFGLTPLAAGLDRARVMLAGRNRRALLLLITDGIPTVPKMTANPLADALASAEAVRKERIPFACIGLEPNRRYLKELADCAGGSLHVVRELEAHRLVAIAREERRQQLGG